MMHRSAARAFALFLWFLWLARVFFSSRNLKFLDFWWCSVCKQTDSFFRCSPARDRTTIVIFRSLTLLWLLFSAGWFRHQQQRKQTLAQIGKIRNSVFGEKVVWKFDGKSNLGISVQCCEDLRARVLWSGKKVFKGKRGRAAAADPVRLVFCCVASRFANRRGWNKSCVRTNTPGGLKSALCVTVFLFSIFHFDCAARTQKQRRKSSAEIFRWNKIKISYLPTNARRLVWKTRSPITGGRPTKKRREKKALLCVVSSVGNVPLYLSRVLFLVEFNVWLGAPKGSESIVNIFLMRCLGDGCWLRLLREESVS